MNSRELVVIVDDEPLVCETLSALLGSEGFTCRCFCDPNEALEQLAALAPIAIFVDINMPQLTGIGLLHELRKSNPDVPVIVITGFPDQEVFRQTLPYKIVDFLTKPLDPDVVRDSLRRALGRFEQVGDQFLETVAHRLREARVRLGLKQSQVAARCEMSTSQVSQIELRQSAPSVLALLRLCKALNLKMTDLVEGF